MNPPILTLDQKRAWLNQSDADFHTELPPNDWDNATAEEVEAHYALCMAQD